MLSTQNKLANLSVLFWVSLFLCAIVAIGGILSPETLAAAATSYTRTAFSALDWFFMTSVTLYLVMSLWLALGKYGKVKLGRPEDRPEFSTVSWIATLFSAGMGVGLLFWGAAEPITHFISPPIGESGTPESARQAMVLTNFHWGLHT